MDDERYAQVTRVLRELYMRRVVPDLPEEDVEALARIHARIASTETPCNLCGLSCTAGTDPGMDRRAGLIDATVRGGYESTAGNGFGALDDLTSYSFSLCEFCLDWLFSQFVIPVATRSVPDGEVEEFRPAAERVENDTWRHGKERFFAESARRAAARTRLKGA